MKITREQFQSFKRNIKLLQDFAKRIEIIKELNDKFILNLPHVSWIEQVQEVDDYDDLILPHCSTCGIVSDELEDRHSMGIYAGKYCSDICWKNSQYKDVGPEEFDPTYAGEQLEPED